MIFRVQLTEYRVQLTEYNLQSTTYRVQLSYGEKSPRMVVVLCYLYSVLLKSALYIVFLYTSIIFICLQNPKSLLTFASDNKKKQKLIC